MGCAMTEYEVAERDGIAIVSLNRPHRRNALTFSLYEQLTHVIQSYGNQSCIRAVVIAGNGPGFCSGGDREQIIQQLLSKEEAQLLEFTRCTGRLVEAIRTLPKPVVAAVHGAAVGAGAVIALACDLRVAAADARFGFIFPRVGLSGADMGATYLLPRVVGFGNASELLLLGEVIDADHALRIGLVNRIVENKAAASSLAVQWACKLAQGPEFAHAMTKRMLEYTQHLELSEALEAEAQVQAKCMCHPDFRAYTTSFAQGAEKSGQERHS